MRLLLLLLLALGCPPHPFHGARVLQGHDQVAARHLRVQEWRRACPRGVRFRHWCGCPSGMDGQARMRVHVHRSMPDLRPERHSPKHHPCLQPTLPRRQAPTSMLLCELKPPLRLNMPSNTALPSALGRWCMNSPLLGCKLPIVGMLLLIVCSAPLAPLQRYGAGVGVGEVTGQA